MAAAQWTCEDTQEIISKSSLKIKFFPTTGKDLACDVSQVTARPVVPVSFRKQVFSSIHNITHPGIRARKQLISVRFVWRKMGSQIAELCRDCRSCAKSKTTTTVHSSFQPTEMPAKRFSHVHINLVGPLPASSLEEFLFCIL
jgi:cleavage and polyadenylation specificity factor subunit 1